MFNKANDLFVFQRSICHRLFSEMAESISRQRFRSPSYCHAFFHPIALDAAAGLLDIRRLGDILLRIKGRIILNRLDQISPLAVPVMLEIGKEPVVGEAQDDILAEAADDIIAEAMGGYEGL